LNNKIDKLVILVIDRWLIIVEWWYKLWMSMMSYDNYYILYDWLWCYDNNRIINEIYDWSIRNDRLDWLFNNSILVVLI